MFPEREPWARENLIKLTEIPAPPFMEEARGRAFADMLRAAGADSVWIDEVGNVLARRRGKSSKKTVVLEAHLDTVFPEGTDVEVKPRGDTLYAPGIGDDTRGLAMVLNVLDVMEKTGLETDADVLFVGTVGEEGLGDLRGVKKLFDTPGLKDRLLHRHRRFGVHQHHPPRAGFAPVPGDVQGAGRALVGLVWLGQSPRSVGAGDLLLHPGGRQVYAQRCANYLQRGHRGRRYFRECHSFRIVHAGRYALRKPRATGRASTSFSRPPCSALCAKRTP